MKSRGQWHRGIHGTQAQYLQILISSIRDKRELFVDAKLGASICVFSPRIRAKRSKNYGLKTTVYAIVVAVTATETVDDSR